MVYAFQSKELSRCDDAFFLAWQPGTYDDGYFWTQMQNFIECIYSGYDKFPHKFTCKNKRSAISLAKSIGLKNYDIVKFRNADI